MHSERGLDAAVARKRGSAVAGKKQITIKFGYWAGGLGQKVRRKIDLVERSGVSVFYAWDPKTFIAEGAENLRGGRREDCPLRFGASFGTMLDGLKI